MTKITDLDELQFPTDTDLFYVVDVSDTTESAAGTSKKITRDNILNSQINVRIDTSNNIKFVDPDVGVALGNEDYIGGAGIKFPSIQYPSTDVNTLDDYEEGTFTPTLYGSASTGVTTYTDQKGNYTKIGRIITYNIYLDVSTSTGTGNIRIGGFPFPCWDNTANGAINNYWGGFNFTLTANHYVSSIALLSNDTVGVPYSSLAGSAAGAQISITTDRSLIFFSNGFYISGD